MPLPVRGLNYLLALVLLWLALSGLWQIVAAHQGLGGLWMPSLCLLTVIGLLRRVAWGRFLFSCISLYFALTAFALLLPLNDDVTAGGPLLERLLGFGPPGWVYWLTIVLTVVLILLPALMIGWRKAWFRPVWW